MRPGGASLHEISEIIGADEVFKEPGGLVTGFALPAPRRSREDLIAGARGTLRIVYRDRRCRG